MRSRAAAHGGEHGARRRGRELSRQGALAADDQEGGRIGERIVEIGTQGATGRPLRCENGKAADDQIGVERIGRRKVEQAANLGRAERLDRHLAQTIVQWPALLGQGAHHRLVGADRHDQDRDRLPAVIPNLLQHRLDARFLGGEIGELIEHQHQGPLRRSSLAGERQCRLPAFGSQARANRLGRGRVGGLQRLDEAGELGLGLLLDSGEEDKRAAGLFSELLRKPRLADPPAASHGDERPPAALAHRIQPLLKQPQLALTADEVHRADCGIGRPDIQRK